MNEFKSRTIIPDYVIRMKLKRGTVFPVYERLTFLLFKWTNSNRKRMLSDYVIHMKLRYSLSCIWVHYMQSPAYKRPHLDTKKKSKFIIFEEDLLWEMYLIKTARSDMALFSRENYFCHLCLPTLVNVLFLHKPVRILLVVLFLNILPNWNVLFNF